MILSHVEILLVVGKKEEGLCLSHTSCKSKQGSDVLNLNKRYVLHPSLPVLKILVLRLIITEEILNQLKNEE